MRNWWQIVDNKWTAIECSIDQISIRRELIENRCSRGPQFQWTDCRIVWSYYSTHSTRLLQNSETKQIVCMTVVHMLADGQATNDQTPERWQTGKKRREKEMEIVNKTSNYTHSGYWTVHRWTPKRLNESNLVCVLCAVHMQQSVAPCPCLMCVVFILFVFSLSCLISVIASCHCQLIATKIPVLN